MFDIIGFGLTFGALTSERIGKYTDTTKPDISSGQVKNFTMGMQYILPGVQYIMDNGFTMGWRNKFNIYFGGLASHGIFGVDTAITVGYTFGSGKQPWEKYFFYLIKK